jgi:hypothetical protein
MHCLHYQGYRYLSFLPFRPRQPLARFLTLLSRLIATFFPIGPNKTPTNLTDSFISSRLSARLIHRPEEGGSMSVYYDETTRRYIFIILPFVFKRV